MNQQITSLLAQKEIKIEWTDKPVTPWGGLTLFSGLAQQVGLVAALREGGDEGDPITVSDPGSEASTSFDAIAAKVIAQGPARVYRQELRLSGA